MISAMNTAVTIAQIASPIVSLIFVIVLGVGYYFLFRASKEQLQEMREEFISGGRPQVIVDDDYGSLPQVNIVVRNVRGGPAKEITFEFSAPVESSDGYVVSELPYFRDGLDFLSPGGEIYAYWDHLDSLLPYLKKKGLEKGISVTTRYKDMGGKSYATTWNLNPFIYEHKRYIHHRGMDDLVDRIERLEDAVRSLSTSEDGRQNLRGEGGTQG
jgi:hypothetical protein